MPSGDRLQFVDSREPRRMNAASREAFRPDRGRLTLALLLTPLLAPFYSAVLFERPWDLVFGLLSSYAGMLLPGIPAALWLLRRRYLELPSFAVLGIACSLPAMLIYAALPDTTHLEDFGVLPALVIAAWGAFSGACFWLVGIAGEPSLTLKSLFDMGPPDRPGSAGPEH